MTATPKYTHANVSLAFCSSDDAAQKAADGILAILNTHDRAKAALDALQKYVGAQDATGEGCRLVPEAQAIPTDMEG